MRNQRALYDPFMKKNHDQWMCTALWEFILNREYRYVHTYLPMGDEINITPLIEKMLAAGITVITPKTKRKRQLQHLVLQSLQELEPGVFGTQHPRNGLVYSGLYDLIIVPGLAFDKNHYRLGYGGGYYDNFLVHYPNAYKLGLAYPFQFIEKIPTENHDVQLDDVWVPPTNH